MTDVWLESLRTAWQVLRGNRLRTFLTALTVAVGAGAIALMSSLSSSAIATITSGIDAVGGRDVVLVYPRAPKKRRGVSDQTLTLDDALALKARVPGVRELDHLVSLKEQTLAADTKKMQIDLGIGAAYAMYVGQRVTYGRDLPPENVRPAPREMLLTEPVAKELFGSPEKALSRYVLLWGHRYRIVGVTTGTPQMGFSLGEISVSRAAFVGARAMIESEGLSSNGMAVLKLVPGADHERALRIINVVLLHRHHGADDFEMFDFQRFLTSWDDIFLGLRLITGIIAAVSLVIAGAGVSNVVLASVRQRVTEIGIRRALGASAADIRRQFLVESMLLALLGGSLGALGGALFAVLLGWAAAQAIPGWEGVVSWSATMIAIATSIAFGWIFGARPARKAARLDVVECLRGAGW